MKKQFNATDIKYIHIDQLRSANYQRVPVKRNVTKISDRFDPQKLGVIDVSLRNGNYYVVDGQHRVIAARMAGMEGLMATVHVGLTYEEEAQLFIALNEIIAPLTQLEIYKSEVEAGDKKALEIRDILAQVGISIGKTGSSSTSAIGKIKSIYNKKGPIHLKTILELTMATWGGDGRSLTSIMMQAVSDFYSIYEYEKGFSVKDFKTRIGKHYANEILSESKNDPTTSKRAVQIVNILHKFYNAKTKTNQLKFIHANLLG